MLTIIFLFLVGVAILLRRMAIKYPRRYSFDVNLWNVAAIVFALIAVLILIVEIWMFCDLGYARVIDSKIAMYAEENTKIENEITSIVDDYKEYEADVMKSNSNSSPNVLIQLYPDLKADELVQKQIDVYNKNNNKIKKLKLEKINYEAKKWLLYFGGNKS